MKTTNCDLMLRERLARWSATAVAVILVPILLDANRALHAQESTQAPSNMIGTGDDLEINYEAMPQVEQGRFTLPALEAPTTDTDTIGNGRLPDGFRGNEPTPVYPLPESASQRAEVWDWSTMAWVAPNTFSNPRYFEDRMLERHGHQRFSDHLQPFAAGARFFTTVPMLPYLMAVRNPCDCEYTLGYYRAGSRTPGLFQRPPYDRRAILTESAVVAGAIIAFP